DGILSAVRNSQQLPEIFQQVVASHSDTEWLQTTAAISNGSSGGPLLTERGELVGINTWVISGQNISFAIHAKYLQTMLNDLPDVCDLPVPGSTVIVSERIARLHNDYLREYQNLLQNAQTAGSREGVRELIARQNPLPIYLRKLADIATADTTQQELVDAFLLAHTIWDSADQPLRSGTGELDRLSTVAASVTDATALQRMVEGIGEAPWSLPLDRFLRHLFNHCDNRDLQGTAGLKLVTCMSNSDDSTRLAAEIVSLLAELRDEFGEVTVGNQSLKDVAEGSLPQWRFQIPQAGTPDIVGTDVDGNPLKLSDYAGKVVVLDFWADWCPHCRAMYGHEREMVERLKNQPFALLGINCDGDPERARTLQNSGTVTWKSWFDGQGGPIAEAWPIEGFPSIYVLDGQRRIRFEGLRGEELEAAVNSLLEEDLVRPREDVLPRNSRWMVHADNSSPPDDWNAPAFDDRSWKSLVGPVSYGPDSDTLPEISCKDTTTTWMRTEFTWPLTASANSGEDSADCLFATLTVDDGAVVYLNGHEIYRTNLPQQSDVQTPATRHSDRETRWFTIDVKQLVQGKNVVAVEVHQAAPASCDLLLDLTIGSRLPEADAVMNAKSSKTREQFCSVLGDLMAEKPELREVLNRLRSVEEASVQLAAFVNLAANTSVQESVAPLMLKQDAAAAGMMTVLQLVQNSQN
ncbi:MAG: redoxin domain-containing protein, partial [Planctomycetaceae bacterium]|nr:redoxin domain-containing protein [Planctomycetaceae bacterium]